MITLYHGANQAFDAIDLQRGLPNKDFGRLFDKGIISLDDFVDGLKFRQVYMQYSFHTNRAVELLEFGEEKDVG